MSRKHPSPIEARWRWHWRRMRILASFHEELWNLGDPLGLIRDAQPSGAIVRLEMVVQDEAEFFASNGRQRAGCSAS